VEVYVDGEDWRSKITEAFKKCESAIRVLSFLYGIDFKRFLSAGTNQIQLVENIGITEFLPTSPSTNISKLISF
jgi:hypothetical protein